jgi:hypothetical protein
MSIIRFRGRVIPTAHQIALSGPFIKHVHGYGQTQTYTVTTEGTMMTVTCELSKSSDEDLTSIMQRARIFGQTVLNVISFSTTTVYRFIIEEGQLPGQPWHRITQGCQAAKGICTVCELGTPSISAVFALANDINVLFALDDLIRGVEDVFLTRINCGRVVDALKKVLAPRAGSKQQWQISRHSLNLDLSYVSFIMKASIEGRHGNRVASELGIEDELLRRTWMIMNRFLELKKRGLQKLPDDEFPCI